MHNELTLYFPNETGGVVTGGIGEIDFDPCSG